VRNAQQKPPVAVLFKQVSAEAKSASFPRLKRLVSDANSFLRHNSLADHLNPLQPFQIVVFFEINYRCALCFLGVYLVFQFAHHFVQVGKMAEAFKLF